jgi:hypothetical protein
MSSFTRHALALLSAFVVAAFLSPISTAATVYSLEPSHDNFVNRSAGSEVVQSPTATTLDTKVYDNGNARNIYLKFDLTGIDLLDAQTASFSITSAIGIDANFPTSWTFQLYALNAGTTHYDWLETNLTNSTAPGYVAGGLPASATLLGQFSETTSATTSVLGNTYQVNFSNLQNYLQADDSITLILVTQSQGTQLNPSFRFASKDHATLAAPTLSFTVPEPGKFSLLSLGSMLFILRRQRRPT